MVERTIIHGCGRGGNPKSQENLKLGSAARRWFVYRRKADRTGWEKIQGPFFQSKAEKLVRELEGANRGEPGHIASTHTGS